MLFVEIFPIENRPRIRIHADGSTCVHGLGEGWPPRRAIGLPGACRKEQPEDQRRRAPKSGQTPEPFFDFSVHLCSHALFHSGASIKAAAGSSTVILPPVPPEGNRPHFPDYRHNRRRPGPLRFWTWRLLRSCSRPSERRSAPRCPSGWRRCSSCYCP